MFLELKNTTFQSITGKIYDFVTPLLIADDICINIIAENKIDKQTSCRSADRSCHSLYERAKI